LSKWNAKDFVLLRYGAATPDNRSRAIWRTERFHLRVSKSILHRYAFEEEAFHLSKRQEPYSQRRNAVSQKKGILNHIVLASSKLVLFTFFGETQKIPEMRSKHA